MPNFVPGVGPFNPDLMCIGEAPGEEEDRLLEPFVGPTGLIFNECLEAVGLSRSEVYITNVVKYRPPLNDFTKLDLIQVDYNEQVSELWKEIRRCQPKCLLLIGERALEAVTGKKGIMNYRGSILLATDGITKCVATIHPAALFDRHTHKGLPPIYLKLIELDFARAKEESKEYALRLPERQLDIARNSLDVYRFIESYKKLGKVVLDIESIGGIPVCVGLAFNRYHALSIPLFLRRLAFKLTDMSEADMIDIWRQLDYIFQTMKLVGANIKYDDFKLGRLGFQLKHIYSDTLIKTRVVFPELPQKGLGMAASIWTRQPYYKIEGKEFKLGKSLLDQLFRYNGMDCAVDFELDEELEIDLNELSSKYGVPLVDYYYNYQMKKHPVYLEMENNGFAVDHPRQKELKVKYLNLSKLQHDRNTELIGHDVNVKSFPQMYTLLYKEMGFKPYKKNPTSEDAIVKLMGNHVKGKDGPLKKEILEGVLEERRIRDQYSRYINFTPDYDGRCKTSFNIIATETCRSSTSTPEKPIRPETLGLAFHTISKHGRLAKDIRSMFVPDKGKIFLQADSSQAEARVVAVLMEDYELLKAFDTIDIHRRTAALILGISDHLDLSPGAHLSDTIGKDSPERFCGKKTRHAGNYDMKKGRFMTEFNTDAQKFEINMSISEWKGGQMLDLFHKASPKIKSVFHQSIQFALHDSRVLIDPFGGVRIFNGAMSEQLYQEGYANIPQRTVAYVVQGAMIKCHNELGDEVGPVNSSRNYPVNFISENHDSLLWQVPENGWEKYAELMKKHMMFPIDFSQYCTLKRKYILTIPCDVEVSDTTYADFIKSSKFVSKNMRVHNVPLSLSERMKILRG